MEKGLIHLEIIFQYSYDYHWFSKRVHVFGVASKQIQDKKHHKNGVWAASHIARVYIIGWIYGQLWGGIE